jgi:c-di-AMP phosphodiesterase-like protein
MEYSRAAIDLALSRGGDQVLIKDREKYSFFGGKTKEIENNTRVRARVKAYALTELIEESENVIIMGHKHADLDCIGSSIGIYRIAETLNKKCNIVLNEITSSISLFNKRKKISGISFYKQQTSN